MPQCTVCGLDFAPSGRRGLRAECCTDRCYEKLKYARRNRVPCAICGEPTSWTTGRTEQATHPGCRDTCGTIAGYRRGCRCDSCRAAVAADQRQYAQRRREQGRPLPSGSRPTYERQCEHCGAAFKTEAKPSRFCTISCSQRHRAGWTTSTDVVLAPRQPKPPYVPTPRPEAPRFWGVLVAGPCIECGTHFVGIGSAARYCSATCRKRAGRRASKVRRGHGSFPISKKDRFAIYERDGWICQLCFDPIDREAHYLDDWAPSLDHIVPRSHMLVPDHSPENARCAHRWCNAVRGAGVNDDLFLAPAAG